MSTILVLCVAAAAVWVVISSVRSRPSAGPKDSVSDFSRALSALSPERVPPARTPPPRRPASRGQRRRRASGSNPRPAGKR